ncbi:hypothetical protein DV737_g2730, partial [Chaetothyriales sp. CBS 132003]
MTTTAPASGRELLPDQPKPQQTRDPTFLNYSLASAATYAKYRSNEYPHTLIDKVINNHVANGKGQLGTLVDVGCGPGIATRQVGTHFDHVFGLDPGVSMIEIATSLGGTTRTGEQIKVAVASAEEIDVKLKELGVEEGTVDLITAATAAHWFDLPKFYAAASRMLRSGGSIAFWATGNWKVAGAQIPNVDQVQQILDFFIQDVLGPYELPGNRLCNELYASIDLPWTCGVPGFDEKSFYRKIWNGDGQCGPELPNGLLRPRAVTWEQLGHMIGTFSMVTRWREANQEAVQKGEVEDCIERLKRELMDAVHNGEKEGDEGWVGGLTGDMETTLLGWKKL